MKGGTYGAPDPGRGLFQGGSRRRTDGRRAGARRVRRRCALGAALGGRGSEGSARASGCPRLGSPRFHEEAQVAGGVGRASAPVADGPSLLAMRWRWTDAIVVSAAVVLWVVLLTQVLRT